MPQTINKTADLQIIAGVFSDPKNADKATAAFQKMGVPSQDIQILAQPDKNAVARVAMEPLFATDNCVQL